MKIRKKKIYIYISVGCVGYEPETELKPTGFPETSTKMGPNDCPETPVLNCRYTLCNVPVKCTSHLAGSGKTKVPVSSCVYLMCCRWKAEAVNMKEMQGGTPIRAMEYMLT